MKKKRITILKQETRYIIKDDKGHSISVIISGNEKNISIYKYDFFNEGFTFKGSDKETVEAIIKLFSEAVKLLNQKNEK